MFSWRRAPWPRACTWRVLIATVPVWIAWIFIVEECPTPHLRRRARVGPTRYADRVDWLARAPSGGPWPGRVEDRRDGVAQRREQAADQRRPRGLGCSPPALRGDRGSGRARLPTPARRGRGLRRDVEAELKRSSRYFELSRDLVCTAGFDGYFKTLNPSWTEALGWTEDELRSRPFVEFVHEDDRARTEEESAGLRAGGVTIDFVNRLATKDGGWRWIEWSSMAIIEEELIYASARDVTQRKVIESALERSDHRTRQIVENAHDAFISIDARGRITGWNSQAEASFGWTRGEALGRELAETIIPDRLRAPHRLGLERFLATGEGPVLGRRLELTALHRDGHEFTVELTISPIEMEQGFAFNAFLRDITDRKAAEQELALARDEALEASRMKSMFLANVSHEIRTPMNGVIGMSELLLDTELDEAQREYAEAIARLGRGAADDHRRHPRLLEDRGGQARARSDATSTCARRSSGACGMLAARAHEKGLELARGDRSPRCPALVRGGLRRLRQVLTNLVANAIKFTADGEVVGAGERRPARRRFGAACASRSPTPASASRPRRSSSSSSRSRRPTARPRAGTAARGSAWRSRRQLVELMGGAVGAESEPGRGSTFWFELPAGARAAADGLPASSRRSRGCASSSSTTTPRAAGSSSASSARGR